MLKKLVKHGNSSALVLDRSILALLDINDKTVLKLRIEGNILIVKAAEEVKPTDAIMVEIDKVHSNVLPDYGTKVLMDDITTRMQEGCDKYEQDPQAMKDLGDWAPGTTNGEKLQAAYGEIFKKYEAKLTIFSSEKFQKEFHALVKLHNDDMNTAQFKEEFKQLRVKHFPGVTKMDQEMQEIADKLGVPESIR